MKYQRHNNTSSLFLLELILAVLFFSVASALCVRIFIKAHLMSQEAKDLNFAVNEVTSMAEQFSSDVQNSADIQDSAASNSSNDTASDSSTQQTSHTSEDYISYYDADYAPCDSENAAYVLTIHYEPDNTDNSDNFLLKAHISMDTIADGQKDSRNIYSLDVTGHRQRRAE